MKNNLVTKIFMFGIIVFALNLQLPEAGFAAGAADGKNCRKIDVPLTNTFHESFVGGKLRCVWYGVSSAQTPRCQDSAAHMRIQSGRDYCTTCTTCPNLGGGHCNFGQRGSYTVDHQNNQDKCVRLFQKKKMEYFCRTSVSRTRYKNGTLKCEKRLVTKVSPVCPSNKYVYKARSGKDICKYTQPVSKKAFGKSNLGKSKAPKCATTMAKNKPKYKVDDGSGGKDQCVTVKYKGYVQWLSREVN